MTRIDLGRFRSHGARILAGRERGMACRMKAELDRLDGLDEPVEVVIPDDILTLNSSFFQAMFGQSVRVLGKQKFKMHYRFNSRGLDDLIQDGIEEAARTNSPLEIDAE